MATSGSIDFTVDRDDIITEALEILGVLGEDETPNSAQRTSMSRTLNMLVKTWQAEGLNLFAVQRTYLFLEKNKHEYTLTSSGDNFATSFISTAVNGALSSGATTVTVDDASSMSSGNDIGIYQSDGTMHWTTISGSPSGNDVNLSAAITADVDDDAVVYYYTDEANRPMRILEAYHSQYLGDDTEIEIVSRKEYFSLPNKDTDGRVNQIYYDPQVTSPTLFVWPETDDPRDYLILIVQRTLDDFDSASDEADFPQEWYLPLAWNLAYLSANKYGVAYNDRFMIQQTAMQLYEVAFGFDNEHGTSVYFQPDLRHAKN